MNVYKDPQDVIQSVYIAYEDYGTLIKSDECKPKEKCSDSDWWFDVKSKCFRAYYTFHDELLGLQTEHLYLKAKKYKPTKKQLQEDLYKKIIQDTKYIQRQNVLGF